MPNQFTSILALAFGFLGLLMFLPAVVGVWILHARISNASGKIFAALDQTVMLVDERVEKTRDRIVDLKITADEIEQGLKKRVESESLQRLIDRFQIEEKAERISQGLEQAEQWIEVADSSAELLKATLDAASQSGLSVSSDRAEQFVQHVAVVKEHVAAASQSVERVRSWTIEAKQGKGVGQDALKIVGRLLLTLTSIDQSCEQFRDQLGQLKQSLDMTESRSSRMIRWVAFGLTFLMLWMAAGQGALCYLGMDGLRRSHSQTAGPPE